MNTGFQTQYDNRDPRQNEPAEEWEQREGAMPGDRYAADPPAPSRPAENPSVSAIPLDFLRGLADRIGRGEATEEVKIFLDLVTDMTEEPENDQLWVQPEPIIIKALIHRLAHKITDEKRRQQHGELYSQQTTPAYQYSDQTSSGCKCYYHSLYQRNSSENTNRMDDGNTLEGGERGHHSHTHCRSSMEERNQCQRRTGYLGGTVAGEIQLRGRQVQTRRRGTSDMASDLEDFEGLEHELKMLEKKRKSLISARNEGLERLSKMNVKPQFVRVPQGTVLDDVTCKIYMIKLQLSQMD
ncbi:uncharacterized protein LOC124168488 [Ischnura elegans]|uniref:uncharacterized protein LOC124168488 n=1 Tax=Ischnura elegans TaxID=197161 RepID=UPI001ED89424|nr:uncharacterized protein LOC124168488 [Ischnura elegans]